MLIHKNIKKKFYSYDDCNFKDLPFFCSQHHLTADSIYAKLSIPMVSACERRWNCCSRVTSWENPTFRVVKSQLLHSVETVQRDLGFELRAQNLSRDEVCNSWVFTMRNYGFSHDIYATAEISTPFVRGYLWKCKLSTFAVSCLMMLLLMLLAEKRGI